MVKLLNQQEEEERVKGPNSFMKLVQDKEKTIQGNIMFPKTNNEMPSISKLCERKKERKGRGHQHHDQRRLHQNLQELDGAI